MPMDQDPKFNPDRGARPSEATRRGFAEARELAEEYAEGVQETAREQLGDPTDPRDFTRSVERLTGEGAFESSPETGKADRAFSGGSTVQQEAHEAEAEMGRYHAAAADSPESGLAKGGPFDSHVPGSEVEAADMPSTAGGLGTVQTEAGLANREE